MSTNLNLNLILAALILVGPPCLSGQQRKKMNTDTGILQLESYILQPDAFHGDAIPKRLKPDVVGRFVMDRVGRDTRIKSLLRVEKVVTFYDLHEVCGHLSSLLPANPTPTDVAKSAVISRTIAAVCTPAEVPKLAGYSHLLIANAQTSSDIVELLELQDRLGPGTDSRALEARIAQLRAASAAQADSNYQARQEAYSLDEMRSLRLDRVRRANDTKAQLLAITERKKRIGEEIKIYLTLEYGYLEYLTPWSAIRLRRETWGNSPADQLVRAEDTGRRTEMASMFRTVESNLGRLPDVDPENIPSLRVRCLRAVEYFGGALTNEERGWITQNAGRQVDVLSND